VGSACDIGNGLDKVVDSTGKTSNSGKDNSGVNALRSSSAVVVGWGWGSGLGRKCPESRSDDSSGDGTLEVSGRKDEKWYKETHSGGSERSSGTGSNGWSEHCDWGWYESVFGYVERK